jgi:pfkB family carbohydrate kinase
MADSAIDYLTIGHLVKDLTPAGPRLGGTVSFASLTARALGYTPGILTAIGDGLDLSPLAGIPIVRVPSVESATFENIYGPNGRTQFKRAEASPIPLTAVPAAWRSARIVHLGPLGKELGGLEPGALDIFPQSFIGVTAQGFLRQIDAAGQVRTVPDSWDAAQRVLSQADAAVLSLDDLAGDWSVAERWSKWAPVLVITQSAEGCTVFMRGQGARQFQAPVQAEVDPTGAGDVFAAAFFINFFETEDAWASARFANQVAALSVTRPGLHGVPDPEEVGFCRVRAAQA